MGSVLVLLLNCYVTLDKYLSLLSLSCPIFKVGGIGLETGWHIGFVSPAKPATLMTFKKLLASSTALWAQQERGCIWDRRSLDAFCKFADPWQYDPQASSCTDILIFLCFLLSSASLLHQQMFCVLLKCLHDGEFAILPQTEPLDCYAWPGAHTCFPVLVPGKMTWVQGR